MRGRPILLTLKYLSQNNAQNIDGYSSMCYPKVSTHKTLPSCSPKNTCQHPKSPFMETLSFPAPSSTKVLTILTSHAAILFCLYINGIIMWILCVWLPFLHVILCLWNPSVLLHVIVIHFFYCHIVSCLLNKCAKICLSLSTISEHLGSFQRAIKNNAELFTVAKRWK